MPQFEIVSDFQMTGDQPQAVDKLVAEAILYEILDADVARIYDKESGFSLLEVEGRDKCGNK